MIRILIADGHPISRYALRALFALEDDFQVVAEAADGLTASDLLGKIPVDIVVLEIAMPCVAGLSLLRSLQRAETHAKVIVLTASEDRNQFLEPLQLGAHGILSKRMPSDEIVKAVRRTHRGDVWLDVGITTSIEGSRQNPVNERRSIPDIAELGILRLTARECEVARFVAHGLQNKEIAEKMQISSQTVKNHLHKIFGKLCISDRLELALFALHGGRKGSIAAPTETHQ